MTTAETQVKALFLFNHRFEANMPVLDRIYDGRFSKRHFIMPFASQAGPRISRVVEQGRNFSGHLAQSARDWVEPGITHYVVVPDDLLLNPRIDEGNIIAALKLAPGQAYIKNLVSADALRYAWPWAGEAAATFRRASRMLDTAALLPDAAAAEARFRAMGITFPGPGARVRDMTLAARLAQMKKAKRSFMDAVSLRGQPAGYPLLAGYSDFLVIPAEAVEDFVHYCGVFAALNIFAEVAVPTALALAADHVRTELTINSHFHDENPPLRDDDGLHGVELWNAADKARHAGLLDGSLDQICRNFPADWLYIHPVKLSRYA